MSNSLWPHGLQHARLPFPSLSVGVCSNSFPLSWWCHPTISSFIVLFSCLQSFPASGSFPMSQLFASGGQSIGASASVLPVNIQGWFPLGLTSFDSLLSMGPSRVQFSSVSYIHLVLKQIFRTFSSCRTGAVCTNQQLSFSFSLQLPVTTIQLYIFINLIIFQ